MSDLSPREVEVLRLFLDGLSAKDVAGRLGISVQTVKNHVQSAYKRLGVRNKISAFRTLGWIQ